MEYVNNYFSLIFQNHLTNKYQKAYVGKIRNFKNKYRKIRRFLEKSSYFFVNKQT